jgi:hypothetical protein
LLAEPVLVTLDAEVVAVVRQLEQEFAAGRVERRLRLVRGRLLADRLRLDKLARVLRAG